MDSRGIVWLLREDAIGKTNIMTTLIKENHKQREEFKMLKLVSQFIKVVCVPDD